VNKTNKIIAGMFLSSLIVISVLFTIYSEHREHELMHVLTLYATIFLAFLSFKAFYNYRLSRLLFSGFAFLVLGVSETVELFDDFEHHDDPFSINEIRDYIIIAAIALFSVGTVFRIKK
jgi:asparagine N-glycosylation enzyme membrane subunit Stt3